MTQRCASADVGASGFIGYHRLIAIERELEIARGIQQQMLPSAPTPLAGIEVGGTCFPAEVTGGDFFDYIPMPNGCVAVVCGDVIYAGAVRQTAKCGYWRRRCDSR